MIPEMGEGGVLEVPKRALRLVRIEASHERRSLNWSSEKVGLDSEKYRTS